jgi:hypothetical protein
MNTNVKKIIKITGFSIFFILILIYAFFTSKDLIFGVKIKNVNLTDGATVTENVIKLTGNARNAISLILDGREISVDEKGNFNETIALLPGYNIINIKAQDKFGNIDEKNYKLILTQALGN